MKIFKVIFVIMFYCKMAIGQKIGVNTENPSVTFEVNGKMRVGDDTLSQVPSGTIRFNPEKGDFEGWDGYQWNNFSPDPRENFWPINGDRGTIGSYTEFSPEDATQGDYFGFSVDIHGSYAVVGQPYWNGGQGRVFVFKKQAVLGYWDVVDTLNSDFFSTTPKLFGFSVAIYGNRIAVGAPHQSNEIITHHGVIEIFKRNGNAWEYETGYAPYDYCRELGFDVDIFENKILGGCPELCNPCSTSSHHYGAVYGEIDAAGGLTNYFIHKTTPSTSVSRFGHAVSIFGDWLAVSSPISNSTPKEDTVYLYKNTSPGTYEMIQKIGGFNPANEFGYAISMHDNKLLIGQRKRDMASADDDRGEAHMYLKNNTGVWQSHINIAGSDTLGMLGHTVATSAIHQIVAGHQDLTGFTTTMQSLKLQAGMYRPYVNITDPQASYFDHKVYDVSVDGNYFIIGLAEGLSSNGHYGGRVFFGNIR